MRRRGLATTLLVALLSIAASARAQQGSSVELRDVLESVRAHHPTILATQAELEAAQGELLSSEGGFDPIFRTRASIALGTYDYGRLDTSIEQPTPWWGTRFFAGYRLGRGGIPAYYGEYGTAEYGEIRAGVAVPLWRDGPIDRRRANIERAEAGEQAARIGVEQQLNDLSRAAAFRYWECVGAAQRLRVARALLELAQSRDAQIAQRAAAGDLPSFERTENQRAVLQRQGMVVSATRAFEQAAIELSLYWRNRQGEPILVDASALPATIAEPSADEAQPLLAASVAQALETRAEARRLDQLIEQQRVELRWAGNQRAPAIDVTATGSHDFGRPSEPSKLYGPQFEASILIDVPLLNRTANGREQAVSANVARLEAQRNLAEDRIRADVRDALSALSAARERLRVAKQELEVAQRLQSGERERFELGDGTMLVLNLREQAAAEAELRVVESLVDYHRARAAHDAARGIVVAPR